MEAGDAQEVVSHKYFNHWGADGNIRIELHEEPQPPFVFYILYVDQMDRKKAVRGIWRVGQPIAFQETPLPVSEDYWED